MKNSLLVTALAVLSLSSLAQADGFRCEAKNTGVMMEVYNHENPAQGTRTPSAMIVFDPFSNQTTTVIGSFSARNQTLAYLGKGFYQAKVDLRFADAAQGRAHIAGTTLAQLKVINLQINFSYASDATTLARITKEIPAKISYVKRTGEVLEENAVCSRYLKN